MDQIPHGLSVMLGTLPFLGAALLVVVVAALAADRHRWIIPGTLAAVALVAGLSAAMEFGPQARSALTSRMEQAEPAYPEPETTETPSDEAPALEEPEPKEPAAPTPVEERPQPAPPASGQPVPAGYVPGDLVPMPDGRQGVVVEDRNTGRRTVVVNPNAAQPPGRQPPDQPASRPTAPLPTTAQPIPSAQPAPEVAVNTTPARTIPPTTSNRPPELPTLPGSPAPSPTGGYGTLVVKINGPLVETAQVPSSSPHLMVILDNKVQQTRPPTRTTENHKDNDPAQPLLAVTYFWENVTFTFNNVEAGWHVLMVDSSLDSAGPHRSAMTGGAQDKNDWNGSIEVKPGATTTVEFGAKSWSTGQLSRIR